MALADCASGTEMMFQWHRVQLLQQENHRTEPRSLCQPGHSVDEEEEEDEERTRAQVRTSLTENT